MKTNRDYPADNAPSVSSLVALVDSTAAAQAAARLYRTNRQGLRYCCDSRELLTAEEGLARDAREIARRAPKNKPESVAQVTPVAIEEPISAGTFEEEVDDLLDLEADADEDHLIDLDDGDMIELEEEALYDMFSD